MSNVTVHEESQLVSVQAGTVETKMVFVRVDDTIETVCRALCQSPSPMTLFVLSEQGTAFRDQSHFALLKEGCVAGQYIGFVIPNDPQRAELGSLALHHGFHSFASLEQARQSIAGLILRDAPVEKVPAPTAPSPVSPALLADAPLPPAPAKQGTGKGVLPLVLGQSTPDPKRRSFTFNLLQYGSLVMIAVLIFVTIGLAAYLAPSPSLPVSQSTSPSPVGQLSFSSSRQFDPQSNVGFNDVISLQLHGLPSPDQGMAYYAWLLPDAGDHTDPPLLLDRLDVQANTTSLKYSSPAYTNLLAHYSGVSITEQNAGQAANMVLSIDLHALRWQGAIPTIPTQSNKNQYTLLSHLRQLLVVDPMLANNQLTGGLALWAMRNMLKVGALASAAREQWHHALTPTEVQLIHSQMLDILEYLDGMSYYTVDVPAGSPWLPRVAPLGLLDIQQNQDPSGLLSYVSMHLTGLAEAPGHTQEQQQLVQQANQGIDEVKNVLQQVRYEAHDLVQYNLIQLQQQNALQKLNEMAILTTEAESGKFDSQQSGDQGGIIWLTGVIQQLATITLTASSSTPSPTSR